MSFFKWREVFFGSSDDKGGSFASINKIVL